jgi:curved DNA-binding protein CbpA
MSRDPYEVLEVKRGASAEELHDAYRRMVKLHHPDRNGGSAASTRRFQEIQEAYDRVRDMRARGHSPPRSASRPRSAPSPADDDPWLEQRMRDLERDLREAKATQERIRQAARDAVRGARDHSTRPTDEELGYYSTDDSFGKILADVRDEVSQKLADARKHPAVKRVADMVDGLEGLTSRFDKR